VFLAHTDAWQAQGRLRQPYGGDTAEIPGWRLMSSGLGYAHLNAACVTDATLADIAEARRWYQVRDVPWGTLVPAGASWPHGRRLGAQRLMALDALSFAGATTPPGFVLGRADAGDVATVAEIDALAFGTEAAEGRSWLAPLCRSDRALVAVGELEGLPVATGYALECEGEAGRSLYLGGIAVVPAARRRGIAAALSSWLVTHGFEAGAGFAHLETDSDDAARVYERLGFEEFSGIDIYEER
jgi:ribosomal protein S18 acetylase RimI-like enzyme